MAGEPRRPLEDGIGLTKSVQLLLAKARFARSVVQLDAIDRQAIAEGSLGRGVDPNCCRNQ